MTLKEILQAVQDRNFETPAQVYATNPAPKYRRLLTFANQAVRKIISAHNWSFLRKTHTVTIVDGQTLYPLPADFYGMVPDTTYRGTSYFPVEMPSTDQHIAERQNYKHGILYQGRIHQGQFEFIDVPPGELTLEYVSNGMVNNGGSYDIKFTGDDSVFSDSYPLLDELIVLATLATYLRAKQSDGADLAVADYISELKTQVFNDTGARTINDLENPNERRTLWRHDPDFNY